MPIHSAGRFDVGYVSIWYAAAAAICFLLFPSAINVTEAFNINRAGKSPDGKAVIKAIISGPDVSPDEA